MSLWDKHLIEAVHQSSQFSSRLLKENDGLKKENDILKRRDRLFTDFYNSLDYKSREDFNRTYGNPNEWR